MYCDFHVYVRRPETIENIIRKVEEMTKKLFITDSKPNVIGLFIYELMETSIQQFLFYGSDDNQDNNGNNGKNGKNGKFHWSNA
mgnify:CR=1 FL=1